MELKVNEVAIPEVIQFNYDELKQELTDKVSMYETMIYTDDQIKQAKADKASLNKLKKALNDERIRREKEYLQPFNEFKTKINEIISIIDKPVAVIDKQVKEYEEKCKEDKRQTIEEYWQTRKSSAPEWFELNKIFDDRWLNASTSMKSIKDNIDRWINRVNSELKTLEALPQFGFESTEEYKRTLDINKAIAEGQRLADIQKRKEEQERLKAEQEAKRQAEEAAKKQAEETAKQTEEAVINNAPDLYAQKPVKEDAQWISFEAYLTVPQALELKEFFNSRNIDFKAI